MYSRVGHTKRVYLDISQRPLALGHVDRVSPVYIRRHIIYSISLFFFFSLVPHLFFSYFVFSLPPSPPFSCPFVSRRCWTDNRSDDELEQGNFRSPSHSRPAVSDATIILSIPSIRARTIFPTDCSNISGDSRGEESQPADRPVVVQQDCWRVLIVSMSANSQNDWKDACSKTHGTSERRRLQVLWTLAHLLIDYIFFNFS